MLLDTEALTMAVEKKQPVRNQPSMEKIGKKYTQLQKYPENAAVQEPRVQNQTMLLCHAKSQMSYRGELDSMFVTVTLKN